MCRGTVSSGTIFWHHGCPTMTPDRICDEPYHEAGCEAGRPGDGARLDRRIWPLAVSVLYVVLGLVYEFRWGPVVRHVPSAWIAPGDLMSDYGTAIQFAQGHFSNVYAPGRGFLSYPGLLVALFPLAVMNNVFHGLWINIKVNNVLAPHPEVFIAPHLPSGFWYQGNLGPTTTHGVEQVIQASAYPY